jgi:hypothetical protein
MPTRGRAAARALCQPVELQEAIVSLAESGVEGNFRLDFIAEIVLDRGACYNRDGEL